jgi:hypothetical protein
MVFDPQDTVRVDPANRIVNTFEPTVYMTAQSKKVKAIPKTVHKVIHHALGGSQEVVTHFINWLAYIVQYRKMTRTAWVIQGTEGTGKGVMMEKILRPLLGENQTTTRRMEELNSQFNGFIKNKLLICVDEVETKSLMNEGNVLANLRNYITEPKVQLREMHQSMVQVTNNTNWIMNSNKANAVSIPKNDRRFNVGKYQPEKLVITEAEVDGIEAELQGFYDYLVHYTVDHYAVNTPLATQDKEDMVAISSSSDAVADALLEGDFGFFVAQMPTNDDYQANALKAGKVMAYEKVLKAILERSEESGECSVSRDELMALFEYTVGNVPDTPHKFTTMLRHKRIIIKEVRVTDKIVRGIKIKWHDHKDWKKYAGMLNPAPVVPTRLKAVK